MVLIEGLGDEVTIVLGLFFLIVILLLAWVSTHTDDIPLIREVGVIVVELRQRHRNRQIRTEQPQEVEIPQSSRDGVPSAEQENGSNNSHVDGNIQEEDKSDGESGSEEQRSDADISPSISSPTTASSPEVLASSPEVLASSQNTSSSASKEPSDELDITPTTHPEVLSQQGSDLGGSYANSGDQDSEVIDGAFSEATLITSSPLQHETEEETLRRRRVQYFLSGESGVTVDSGRNDCQSSDSLTNVTDNTKQHETVSNLSDCDKKEQASVPSEVVDCADNSNEETQSSGDLPRQRTSPQQQNEQEEGIGDDFIGSRIRVKLKYMNETQRLVYASPEDTIGDFRRTHFQSELEDNKWVRFIFNGQDLRDDARTLQACNIENNCTMHCLVTTRHRQGERQEVVVEDEEESMLGAMMYPLFTLLLMIVWYFRIFYRQYFSAMSTVCLIGISFLLALSYVSSIRPSDTSNQQARARTGTAAAAADSQQNHPHSD